MFKPSNRLAKIATQEGSDLTDLMVIVTLTLLAHTTTQAVSDMIFQTDLIVFGLDRLFSQIISAVSKWIELLNEIHQQTNSFEIGKGSKILRPIFNNFSGSEHSWESLIFNADPRIGFIISQQDIVAWLMFFNQGVFQNQCIGFGRYNDMFDRYDILDEPLGFFRIDLFSKIRRHPVFKIFGFADINNFLLFVIKLIYPWLIGKGLHMKFYRIFRHVTKLIILFVFNPNQ